MFGFELPPQHRTQFFAAVWEIARLIPSGKVTAYGKIAAYIPCPEGIAPEDYQTNAARWVGSAMAESPRDVPWQRVLSATGKITYRKNGGMQRRLLIAEGVAFDEHERINWQRCGWEGPGEDWLRQHGLDGPAPPAQPSLFG